MGVRAGLTLAAVFVWTAPLLAQERAPGEPVTLEQAIRFALDRSPRLATARYAADAAGARHAFLSLSRLPRVTLLGIGEFFPVEDKLQSPRHMDIPATAGPEMLDFFRQQFQNEVYNLRAIASLPIFTSGRLSSQISAADHLVEAAEGSARATRDGVIFNVAAAYYTVLQLQKVVAATEATVRSLEESERIVARQVDVGRAAPVDLFRIRTRLANTRQRLIQLNGSFAKSKTVLRAAMGLEDVLQPIELVDTLGYAAYPRDLAAAAEEALRTRPDYVAQSEVVEARGRLVRAAVAAAYLPQVSFNGFYNQGYGTRSDVWQGDAGFFVSISLGFLDPVNPAAVSEARAARRAEEQRLQDLRLEVTRQVETAYLDVGEAEQRIGAAEAALAEAREVVRIERMKLDVGKAIINDLLDAEADLLVAEVNHATALADYNVAVFALERAVGGVAFEALLGRR